MAIAMAGIRKPIAHEMFSCTYTMNTAAIKDPTLMEK